MRRIGLLLVGTLALGACDKFGGSSDGQAQLDAAQLTSAGEVQLADGNSMPFDISSEQYKQWDQARRAFPKSLITRFGQVLQPRSPTERSIANAVALLEGNPGAKRAIESAGLSVRGFVEITVALEQQMQLATTRGAQPAPAEPMYPITMDTGYQIPVYPTSPYPPATPAPVTPYPAPVTPYPVPVTPTPTPAPTSDPVLPPPRDTIRRDTISPLPPVPRRDTMPVRRDTAPTPPPVDTSRGPTPPDSIPRA